MEMYLKELLYQRPSVKDDEAKLAALEKKLKVINKNIDRKVLHITKLQELISAQEMELKKYIVEEKQLIACIKKI